MSKRYYSTRIGNNPNTSRYNLPILRRLFRDFYLELERKGYFQETFGYHCYEEDRYVYGKLGPDIEAQIFRAIRKDKKLWPIEEKCQEDNLLNDLYSEDDLFDVIEFLYENVSKPIDGYDHGSICKYHYYKFDKEAGQQEFRNQINELLCDYKEGYELSENGEILESPEQGLEDLLSEKLPTHDPENVEQRVQAAILKFRRYHSSPDEKRDAVRDLAAVLEFLRPNIKAVLLNKDEDDLFNLANNFGIRHHKDKQKQDYDKDIWYSWMFYYYLATIHACLKLIKKAEK